MTVAGPDHHVLIVEDDETIRESIVELLRDHGYLADAAADGREALAKLGSLAHPPCLIVLDLMMPVMDGREFRQHQLRDPALSAIPVVVVSAYRDLESLAAEMQPAAMLKKPVRLADLLGVIRQHCTPGQEV